MPTAIGGAAVGAAGTATNLAAQTATTAGTTALTAGTSLAQGTNTSAAMIAAKAEAEIHLQNMVAMNGMQNKMALTKGIGELGKEGSKAVSTAIADSGKAATAQ